MHDPYKSLYIHIPFCLSRCNYCDFKTKAVKRNSKQIDSYFEYLVTEVRKASKAGELQEIETIYIGGGTPTFAGSKNLTQLLYALGVSLHLTPDVECSIEANPESLDKNLVCDIWALGVNRISIGVQSFDDDLLKALGRPASADDARRAIDVAQTRFENVSVDLMCGLPGQTLEGFLSDVEEAIDRGVKHISIYPLTIERGTKFDRMMRFGRLQLPDEDLQADMLQGSADTLKRAGMLRYEVSNYAYPSFESRHNINYWKSKPYLGIGDSAVTMTQNEHRRMRVQDGIVTDDLTPDQAAAEDLMLAMRMSSGADDLQVKRAQAHLPQVYEKLGDLEGLGLIEHRCGAWRPTDKGWLLGNELYMGILDLTD